MKIKKTLLFLGLLSAAFVFASCDSKTNNSGSSNSNNTSDNGNTDEPNGNDPVTPDPVNPDPVTPDPVNPDPTDPEPDVEYVTVSYYEGDSSNKVLLGTQDVIKDRILIDQLEAPEKEGYDFIDFHLVSSNSAYFVSPTFVITKNFSVFVEYKKIDYNTYSRHTKQESNLSGYDYLSTGTAAQQANFYQGGYVKDKFNNFDQYKNTAAYVTVSTADQFIEAIANARNEYTSEVDEVVDNAGKKIRNNVRKNETNWINAITKGLYLLEDGEYVKIPEDVPYDQNDTYYTADKIYYEDSNASKVTIKQTLTKAQTVHVIEITNDIDLGYKHLSNTSKSKSFVNNFSSNYQSVIDNNTAGFYVSSMLKEHGVSEIEISGSTNLLIYSKNGAKLTHGGFKITSSDRIAIRNLEFDELWQWEDSHLDSPNFTVGDMDLFKWAYFKISFSGYIWIDHCTFGKAYDGIIDVSNPYVYSYANAPRVPYGKPSAYTEDDSMGVHISNCLFKSGSDDPNGYLYKMMEEIEADYQKSLADESYSCKCQYYKTLRSYYNLTFEEILYGIAIPHKKAFLFGDSNESKSSDTYYYNQHLKVSLANNIIIDIEDRLPNVRGGIGYVYNTLVDNSRYYEYRAAIAAKGAGGINAVNSKYKLALVSQGVVGGYGASICIKNSIYIGVNTLIKNNNSEKNDITPDQMKAGYSVIDSIWYNDVESSDVSRIINTDTDPNAIQSTVGQTSPMSATFFNWHNEENEAPFTFEEYELSELTSLLTENQYVGVNEHYAELYLIVSETA